MDQQDLSQQARTDLMADAVTAQRDTYLADRHESAIREDARRASGEVVEREPRVRPYRPISDAIERRRLDDGERARDMRSAR